MVVVRETAQQGAAEVTLTAAEARAAASWLRELADGADGAEREFSGLAIVGGARPETVLVSGPAAESAHSVILGHPAAREVAAALWVAAADAEMDEPAPRSAPETEAVGLDAERTRRALAVAAAHAALGQQRADVVAAARFIHTGT